MLIHIIPKYVFIDIITSHYPAVAIIYRIVFLLVASIYEHELNNSKWQCTLSYWIGLTCTICCLLPATRLKLLNHIVYTLQVIDSSQKELSRSHLIVYTTLYGYRYGLLSRDTFCFLH